MTPTVLGDDGLLHRYAWIWDALPADCRFVSSLGDPVLRRYLDESGLQEPQSGRADALLAELPSSATGADLQRVAEADVEFLAVAIGGGEPKTPRPVPTPVRALQLIAGPLSSGRAAATARRADRLLRARGFATRWMPTGDRSRRHGLGYGGWVARRRFPIGWIVTATRHPQPSVVETAISMAMDRCDMALARRGATVYESGKILVDLAAADGDRYVLRLAGGPAKGPLVDSIEAILTVAAALPGPEGANRLALPAVHGESGPAQFSLEPVIAGKAPTRIGDRLAEEALDFLETLRQAPADRTGTLRRTSIDEQAERLNPFLPGEKRAALSRIAKEVEGRVGALRAGIGHGDFWRENLIVRENRLAAVIDWEWTVVDALPALDLFDFITLGQRRASQPTPGMRLTSQLLPLLGTGSPPTLIARYCRDTGIPDDPATLEALAVAYWLDRTSRELLPWWDRLQRDGWLRHNVHEPLATLVAAGW